MDEIKVGQNVTYEIGGRTLTLKPLTLGKIKRAMDSFGKDEGDQFRRIAAYLSNVFENGVNEGIDFQWILENITLPQATQIIEDSQKINGLNSFFPKATETPSPMIEKDLS